MSSVQVRAATGYRPRLRAERVLADLDADGLRACRRCGMGLAFVTDDVWCSDQC